MRIELEWILAGLRLKPARELHGLADRVEVLEAGGHVEGREEEIRVHICACVHALLRCRRPALDDLPATSVAYPR
jgi:hypothetical protein